MEESIEKSDRERRKKLVGEREKRGYEMQRHICSDPSTTVKRCCSVSVVSALPLCVYPSLSMWSLFSGLSLWLDVGYLC